MSQREREPKRERRARARAEKEARRKRAARRTVLRRAAAAGALVVAPVVAWVALGAQEDPADGLDAPAVPTVTRDAVDQAAAEIGCTRVDAPALEARHLDGAPPPPAELYPVRPTASGPHLPTTAPVGVSDRPLDERATTHNLEHGAVVVWYDPAQADQPDVDALAEWARSRNEAGFASAQGGGGILVSPYEGPFDSGAAVALRAWGQALDCEGFSSTVGDGFLIDHYGSHGEAPEGRFSPYPEHVLAFADEQVQAEQDVLPDLEFTRFRTGEQDRLGNYRGRPLVINFFASWCVPCITELPRFVAAYERHRDQVEFLGVNLADDPGAAAAVIERTGISYPVGVDAQGVLFQALGGFGMPTTLFVDADGTVHELYTGELSAEQLVDKLATYGMVDRQS